MRESKSLNEQIREAKLKIWQLEEEYRTALYFETMPEYDPLYKYCYTTSSNSIPFTMQSVDAWVRAVILHMGRRKRGHGGETTDAVVISIPQDLTERAVENWLEYVTTKLRKRVKKYSKTRK